MKKALITGITGQDGFYLSNLLLEKGYEVLGMYRKSTLGVLERVPDLLSSNKTRLVKRLSQLCLEVEAIKRSRADQTNKALNDLFKIT